MKQGISIFLGISFLLSLSLAVFSFYPFPDMLPSGFTFEYIKRVMTNEKLLVHTIGVGLVSATLSTIIGFFIAYSVTRYNFAAKRFLLGFFQLSLFFPAISMFIGIHIIMLKLEIANTFIAVVIAHLFLSIPYGINIGISYFYGIPVTYEQISKTLGAMPIQTFWRVLFPLLRPGIALSLSITFLISASEYFATYLIGGGRIRTIAGDLYPYISNFDHQSTGAHMFLFLCINGLFFWLFHRKVASYKKKGKKYEDFKY